jgi:hypothetical protein
VQRYLLPPLRLLPALLPSRIPVPLSIMVVLRGLNSKVLEGIVLINKEDLV